MTTTEQLSTSGLAGTRHLAVVPALEYAPCPRWCGGHHDRGGVRVHTGPAEIVVGSAVVTLSVEVHDDGRGNVRELFWLGVAGVDVELSPGRTHDLMKAMDRVFWKLDRRGNLLGVDPAVNELRTGVRDRLAAAGISQAELARRAHISPAHLCKILNGERVPSDSVTRAIDAALGAVEDVREEAVQVSRSTCTASSQPLPTAHRAGLHNRGGRA